MRTACDPRVESSDGRVLHPCGLSAGAVFTDVFSAVAEDQQTEIELDESREAICWDWDLSTFKNPSEEEMNAAASEVDFWLFNQTYASALHMDKPGKARAYSACFPHSIPFPVHPSSLSA